MALFDGLGALARGVGAGALGYGQGTNKGEQEAWRRKLSQDTLATRYKAAKTPKEDEPLPLKALFDARERVLSSNDPNAWKNWIDTGQEAAYNQVTRGYTEGYTSGGLSGARSRGLSVLGIANRYEDEDATDDITRLSTAGTSDRRYLGAPEQKGPDNSYVRPALKRAKPTVSDEEKARTAHTTAQTKEILDTLPTDIALLTQQLRSEQFRVNDLMRERAWEHVQDTFKNWMDRATLEIKTGQGNAELAANLYGKVMNAYVELKKAGGQIGKDLDAYLKIHTKDGDILNPAVARAILSQKLSPEQVESVIRSWTISGGMVNGDAGNIPGLSGNGPAGGTQPPPGGYPPQGGPQHLQGAQGWVESQGFRISSPIGAGDRHNTGSQHYSGNAFDVSIQGKSPQEVDQLISVLSAQGLKVGDERQRPPGQAVWTGPHIHVEGMRQAAGGTPQLPPIQGAPGAPGGTAPSQQAAQPGSSMPTTAPNSGAGPSDASLPGMGPRTAQVPNPYDPERQPLEFRVINALRNNKSAQQIIDGIANSGVKTAASDAARASAVIRDYVEKNNVADPAHGQPAYNPLMPTPPSGGPMAFTNDDYLYYSGRSGPMTQGPDPQPYVPSVPTRPFVNGSFAQQPEVVVQGQGQGQGQYVQQPGPPAEAFPTSQYSPPPGKPSLGPAVYGGNFAPLPSFDFQMPDFGTGPSLYGMAPGAGGPPVTAIPEENRGAKAQAAAKGPKVGVKGQAKLDSDFQTRMAAGVKSPKGQSNVVAEVNRYKKHELAPAVTKWLAKHKITKPEAQRQVFQTAIGDYGKEVASLPKGQRNQKLFKILEQRLNPAS